MPLKGRSEVLPSAANRGCSPAPTAAAGAPQPCIPSSAPPSSTTSNPQAWLADVLRRTRRDAAEPARRTPPLELAGQPAARSRRIAEHVRPIRPDQQRPADKLKPTYPAVLGGRIPSETPSKPNSGSPCPSMSWWRSSERSSNSIPNSTECYRSSPSCPSKKSP